MLNTVLTCFLLAFVAFITMCLVYFAVKLSKIQSLINSFFMPEGEGKPSPAGLLFNSLVDQAGLSVARQIKATLMGQASGASRGASALAGDIAQDMVEGQQPGLGDLLSAMPSVKKRLGKNPGLISLLPAALSLFKGGGQPAGSNGSKSDDSAGFSSKRGRY